MCTRSLLSGVSLEDMCRSASSIVYVVTGERGSGKSTVCAHVARTAVARGLTVAGILTERCDLAGRDRMRRVVDLRTGESRPLGARRANAGDAMSDRLTPDPLTPAWVFEPQVFAWANDVFARSTPCDLLVVDELGPLELLGNRGWSAALEALRSGKYTLALVVCRPALLVELDRRLQPVVETELVEVTPETREVLPAVLGRRLCRFVSGC